MRQETRKFRNEGLQHRTSRIVRTGVGIVSHSIFPPSPAFNECIDMFSTSGIRIFLLSIIIEYGMRIPWETPCFQAPNVVSERVAALFLG
jgi:hypothetical protein